MTRKIGNRGVLSIDFFHGFEKITFLFAYIFFVMMVYGLYLNYSEVFIHCFFHRKQIRMQ